MKKSKIIFRKLNIVLVLVLVLSFTFSLPCSAEDKIFYVNFSSSTQLQGLYYKDTLENPTLVNCGYEDQYVYGDFTWSRFWVPSMYQESTSKEFILIFNFNFMNLTLPGSTVDYFLDEEICISNQFGITNWPEKYSVVFVNSSGVRQPLSPTISGNVCYIRENVSQTFDGSFNLEVSFTWEDDASTTARHLNFTRMAFIRDYLLSDVSGEISDKIDESTDKITDKIDESTDKILNADGDGSIHDSNSALKDSISDKDNAEKSIDDIRKELEELPKPTYNPDSVSDLNPSFEFIGQSFTSIVLGFGIDYQNLWWILVSLGLFGSCFGVVLLIFRR